MQTACDCSSPAYLPSGAAPRSTTPARASDTPSGAAKRCRSAACAAAGCSRARSAGSREQGRRSSGRQRLGHERQRPGSSCGL
eukprot:3800404-Rhodomonas_salina.1